MSEAAAFGVVDGLCGQDFGVAVKVVEGEGIGEMGLGRLVSGKLVGFKVPRKVSDFLILMMGFISLSVVNGSADGDA